MATQTFESELRNKLLSKNVKADDINFIMSLIRSSELDENLKIMDNDVYIRLEKRGLCKVFEDSCEELGFKFTHNNDPVR